MSAFRLSRLVSGFALGLLAAPLQAQEPPAFEVDPDLVLKAVAFFEAQIGEDYCLRSGDWLDEADLAPQIHPLPPHPETGLRNPMFQFLCNRGAYNESFLFVSADEAGRFTLHQFPLPDLDVTYENDDFEGAVQEIRITGLRLKREVVNAAFDPETGAVSEDSRWRGIGDASASALWSYERDLENPFGPAYRLTEYQVDASYNGEVDPVPVLPLPIAVTPAP